MHMGAALSVNLLFCYSLTSGQVDEAGSCWSPVSRESNKGVTFTPSLTLAGGLLNEGNMLPLVSKA